MSVYRGLSLSPAVPWTGGERSLTVSGPSCGSNCSPGWKTASSGQKNCWGLCQFGEHQVRKDNEQPDCIITGADVSLGSSLIHISGLSYKSELQGHLKGKHLLKTSQTTFVRGVREAQSQCCWVLPSKNCQEGSLWTLQGLGKIVQFFLHQEASSFLRQIDAYHGAAELK